VSTDEHIPHRPTWRCAGCLKPWPCELAQQHLRAAFDGTPASLSAFLTDLASWAEYDLLGTGTAAEVRKRIVGWPAAQSR
jgi:hypothetical protein